MQYHYSLKELFLKKFNYFSAAKWFQLNLLQQTSNFCVLDLEKHFLSICIFCYFDLLINIDIVANVFLIIKNKSFNLNKIRLIDQIMNMGLQI